MQLEVYNLKREKAGTVEVSDQVFAAEVKEQLFYEVVKAQLASRRAGTQKAKTRSEVSGSSKKLYKQKGTGRSRHGSIRAPSYVKGGRAHPPQPRDWSYRPPRKVRVGALISALSLLVKEGRLLVVDNIQIEEIKTKAWLSTLETLQCATSALIVDVKDNEKLRLSTANLPKHTFLPPEGVNVYDILRHDHLILSKAALDALEKRLLSDRSEP
jgi:large subunit ribosomal protein L4